MTTLSERLATLGPAGRAANKVWANDQVRQALDQIERVLPYNPDLPDDLKNYFLHTANHENKDTEQWAPTEEHSAQSQSQAE